MQDLFSAEPASRTETRVDVDVRRILHGVSAIGQNITDMVEAEEELEQAMGEKARLAASETAAHEASRLKTEFSHEVRTPVAGIITIAELLLSYQALAN